MMKIFPSTCSRGYHTSTVIILIVILAIMTQTTTIVSQKPLDTFIHLTLLLLIILLMVLPIKAYFNQLKEIIVDNEYIIIKKKAGKIIISRRTIRQIQPVDSIRWDTCIWGNALLFGCMGWFYKKSLGKYRAVANNGNHLVAIRTDKQCYVVSCDEREKFIELIGKRLMK